MNRGRYIVIALTALLVTVAWPTAVVAQSAGEGQYEDPLPGGGGGGGNDDGGGSGGGGGGSDSGSQGGSGGGGGGSAPTQQAGTQTDPTPQADQTPAQAAPSDSGLPRTGFPIAMLVIAGAAMVVSGFSLRRNT
jgi:hypothetical protein